MEEVRVVEKRLTVEVEFSHHLEIVLVVSEKQQPFGSVSLVLEEVIGQVIEEGAVDSLESSGEQTKDLHLLPQYDHNFSVFQVSFKSEELVVIFQEFLLAFHVQEIQLVCRDQHSIPSYLNQHGIAVEWLHDLTLNFDHLNHLHRVQTPHSYGTLFVDGQNLSYIIQDDQMSHVLHMSIQFPLKSKPHDILKTPHCHLIGAPIGHDESVFVLGVNCSCDLIAQSPDSVPLPKGLYFDSTVEVVKSKLYLATDDADLFLSLDQEEEVGVTVDLKPLNLSHLM